jgi:hypothetical protein
MGGSQRASERGEEEEGEEGGQEEEEVEGMPDGLRINQPDLITINTRVHFDPNATVAQLEEVGDDVYRGVEDNVDGVWVMAKTYANQEVNPMTASVTPPEGITALRDLYPNMWQRPDTAWEAIRNLIRNGAIQQKKATRGLILFLPGNKKQAGRGKGTKGGKGAGGVNKIHSDHGS